MAQSVAAPAPGQPCGSLARVLARTFREAKPEILDLGPLCGETAVYLAGRGARLHHEEVEPPPPPPPRQPGKPPEEAAPVLLEQESEQFHLVLAWETLDFVPPERLAEYGQELRRVLREGGVLFVFSHARPGIEQEPMPRYRMLADDLIVRQETAGKVRRRWVHPNREIERALAGLSVQGIHLQRSQMREIVAVKASVG